MPVITLVNPVTGVRFHYEGSWLRQGKATNADVRRGRARFIGEKVHLPLPPGVQIQLDKGNLQVDSDYAARVALEASQTVDAMAPKGNSSFDLWLEYAVSQGMDRGEAAGLTRDQIRARFTAPSFNPDAAPDMDILNEDELRVPRGAG